MKHKSIYKAIFGEKLYKAYRYIKDKKDVYETPSKTALGFNFSGNDAMVNGSFESIETELLLRLIPANDVFINVGANIGYYCCMALQLNKKTIAFEPINSNLQYLYRNIKANKWENNVEIYPIALSNSTGLISIFGEGTGASLIKGWANTPEDDVTIVPCTTMDNIIEDKLGNKSCLILVDVEGAEKMMLEGASKILKLTNKITWMIEISINEHLANGNVINPNLIKTFDIFYNNNYYAWSAEVNGRSIERIELLDIINTGIDTIKTHNFIFSRDPSYNIFMNNH
jgi:FkbM family methyltransferase